MEKDEERRALEAATRGDLSAFREIVRAHQRQIYLLSLDFTGNHEDAEDVMQEVLIKAYRSLSRFRGHSSLRSWLYRITVNSCLDHRRKSRSGATMRAIEDESHSLQLVDEHYSSNPEERAHASDVRGRIEAAILRLTPSERSVFLLRYYHQLSTREVAEILERSEGTVKNTLFRSIQKLRRELAAFRRECGEEVG